MTILNFGYTWWGKKWLDALSQTDYSNRLPRGKSYARKDKVKSIVITSKGMAAKVQGSFPIPYNVSLGLQPFSAQEKKKLLDIIINNSIYLAALLNRKLPTELYQDCEKTNIRLFPKSWNSVQAKCSCPDWAHCCKHIAAVVYMTANEIDKNPFLVFELHGLNIFNELEQRGYVVAENDRQAISHYSRWLEEKTIVDNWQLNWDTVGKIDFSLVPYLREQILSLLDSNPLFFPQSDFKKIMEKLYRNVASDTEELLTKTADESTANDLQHITNLTIELNEVLDEQIILETTTLNKRKRKIKTSLEFGFLMESLQKIPIKKLPEYQDKVVLLYFLKNLALKLLQQGAFIPEIITVAENAYRIRWLPALLNQTVNEIFKQLVPLVPSEIINMQTEEKKLLTPVETLKTLLALFMRFYIAKACVAQEFDLHHEILSAFFYDDILTITSFANKELPITIALWLNKFYITHKSYVPILKVIEFQNDFAASILVENRKKLLADPITLEQLLESPQYQSIAIDIFKDLQLLEAYFPEMATILNSRGKDLAIIDGKKIIEFLTTQLPILKMLNIPLLLPKGLEDLVRPKLNLSVRAKSLGAVKSYLSLQEMLHFDWEIALGNERINREEFAELLKDSHGIVKIKDQFIYLDEKEIQKILRNLEKEPELSNAQKLFAVIAQEYNGIDVNLAENVKKLLNSLRNIGKVQLPKSLLAKLRPYQQRGYEWLYKNACFGFGSLIADDMGLGKTVQIISLLLKLKADDKLTKHPALVVVPTSLLSNWQAEIEKFSPTLNTHVYYGTNRKFIFKDCNVVITSYGLLRKDIENFAKYAWPALIIDEAQNIKNPTTDQTKAIKKIKSGIRIAMTGTPVENRLSEYWSIFDFLNKGYLHGLDTFKKEFAVPIEIERNQERLELFKKATAPFILRRLKTDKRIINDLPQKIEIDQYNQLSKQQTALYQSIVNNIMQKIENTEGMERCGLIFKLMTSLKQVCNHPAHYQKKKEIQPELSGKTSVLLEILKTIYENNEKVIIFTQYTEMGELLQKLIMEQHKTEALFFHGGLSRKKRDELVQTFQSDSQINTMLLSLKAGGTGLNLTAARNVIHFDLWWNPAVETQATDRAYRIGQKENVMVYRMITKNTFEEKINNMLKGKKELANLTVGNGEKWIGEFSNKELAEIFKL